MSVINNQYLLERRESGRKGGQASAKSRREKTGSAQPSPEAVLRNPEAYGSTPPKPLNSNSNSNIEKTLAPKIGFEKTLNWADKLLNLYQEICFHHNLQSKTQFDGPTKAWLMTQSEIELCMGLGVDKRFKMLPRKMI